MMDDEQSVTLCYERMEDGCVVELCVTAYGESEKEAAAAARVKLETTKRQVYYD